MNHHRAARISQCIFFYIMALLYVTFMLCDFFDVRGYLSSILKFTSIVGCFFYSLSHHFFQTSDKGLLLINLGLFFTVISDVFLLFTEYYFYGVLSFCVVQLLYCHRILLWNIKLKLTNMILRILAIVICLTLLAASQIKVDAVLIITMIYFINFIGNLILLATTYQYKKHLVAYRRFVLGMSLFFLCDLCVGAFNLSSYLTIEGNFLKYLVSFSAIGMWGFYLPGQVFIAHSCKETGSGNNDKSLRNDG